MEESEDVSRHPEQNDPLVTAYFWAASRGGFAPEEIRELARGLSLSAAACAEVVGRLQTLGLLIATTDPESFVRPIRESPRRSCWSWPSRLLSAGSGLCGWPRIAVAIPQRKRRRACARYTLRSRSWRGPPAPMIGALVGMAAGLYPALRAALIEPIEALRR